MGKSKKLEVRSKKFRICEAGASGMEERNSGAGRGLANDPIGGHGHAGRQAGEGECIIRKG